MPQADQFARQSVSFENYNKLFLGYVYIAKKVLRELITREDYKKITAVGRNY